MSRKRTKRRGSYQSLAEVQEDSAMRMAGDAITEDQVKQALADTIIADIRGETAIDAAMQDAMEYLPRRRSQLAALGTTEEQLNKLQDLGGVPAPLVTKYNDGEIRQHTEYTIDPTTEQKLVVGYMNPDAPDQVLTTTYGVRGIDPSAGHQAEPAMANALRLLGYNVNQQHDPQLTGYNRRTGRPYSYTEGKSDLQASKDGGVKNVDVMVDRVDEKTVPLPLYTSLSPASGSSREAERMIKSRLSQQGNADVRSAVEGLVSEGQLGPKDNKRAGKLMRADTSVFTGDAIYDELIMPGYSREVMNRPRGISPQNVPTPPSAISSVNLRQALNALAQGKAEKVKYNTNYGYNRTGPERLQVKPEFVRTTEAGITDAVAQHPILQQLLDTQTAGTLEIKPTKLF